jgi:hypothetical protein
MLKFGLTHDLFGRLVHIDADGIRHVGVTPVRAFPNTDPDQFISIVDNEGHELVCIEDLSSLADATRQTLEEEFASREFAPKVRRIVSVSALSEPSEWIVDTDRGRSKFVLQSDGDVRRLDGRRAMIVDAHGTRYQIEDIQKLDTRSRRHLERYL